MPRGAREGAAAERMTDVLHVPARFVCSTISTPYSCVVCGETLGEEPTQTPKEESLRDGVPMLCICVRAQDCVSRRRPA